MEMSPGHLSRSHRRRHSSLSGNSLGHFSFPSSPQRSSSIAEPSSLHTFSSLSTYPPLSEHSGDDPSSTKTNIQQLHQLHLVLKEQNTLLQQLAAKAAVALEKRGEAIPDDFLRALSHKRQPSAVQLQSQRCLSSSFADAFPRSPKSLDRFIIPSSRRHSVGYVPFSNNSRPESPLGHSFGEYVESPTHSGLYDQPFRSLVDSEVAEIQGLIYFKRVELCAPVSDRDDFHPSTQELDGDFFNVTSERNSLFPGCPTADWKYCVPTFASDIPTDEWQVTRGTFPTIGGCPNYVPPWELNEQSDGYSYHLDDTDLSWPFERPDPLEFETHEVPYSFSAPFPIRLNGESRLAKTGLTVGVAGLSDSLGTLFAAPPDARIPLTFERNELRLMCASSDSGDVNPTEKIDNYLSNVRMHLRDLVSHGGEFHVRDFNFWMRSCAYRSNEGHLGQRPASSDPDPPHWVAVKPSLLAEQQGFMTMPTSHYIVTRSRLPVLERARQWYRLVYYHGLERTLDLSNNPIETAKEAWKLLVYEDQRVPRLPRSRQEALLSTFERYFSALSSHQNTTSPNPSSVRRNDRSRSWAPFCLSWLSFQSHSDKLGSDILANDGDQTNLRLGSLVFKRSATSILLLPHTTSHDPESYTGPTDSDRNDFIDKGKYYWSLLVLSTDGLNTSEFKYPYTVMLQLVDQILQNIVASWEDIASAIFEDEFLPSQSGTCSPAEGEFTLSNDLSGLDASLKPSVSLTHPELVVLSTMIEANINEWVVFQNTRVPLFRKHHEIYKTKYGPYLDIIAANPLQDDSIFDLHLQLDNDLVGSLSDTINSRVDHLRLLKHRLDKAAYEVRLEDYQENARKSMVLLAESLMMASVQDSSKPLAPYVAFFQGETRKVLEWILKGKYQQLVSLVIVSCLVCCSAFWSFIISMGETSLY